VQRSFIRKRTTRRSSERTHTMRCHAHYHQSGMGHVYQQRYKSFPIRSDEHFNVACRYVERNSLRAGLVQRAEDRRWSSLYRWLRRHVGPNRIHRCCRRGLFRDIPVGLSESTLPCRKKSWLPFVYHPNAANRSVMRVGSIQSPVDSTSNRRCAQGAEIEFASPKKTTNRPGPYVFGSPLCIRCLAKIVGDDRNQIIRPTGVCH
jgi:hypothetical protein